MGQLNWDGCGRLVVAWHLAALPALPLGREPADRTENVCFLSDTEGNRLYQGLHQLTFLIKWTQTLAN